MSQITVKPQKLKREVDSLYRVSTEIYTAMLELNALSVSLRASNSTDAYERVAKAIKNSSKALGGEKDVVVKMKTSLDQIYKTYVDTEKDISGYKSLIEEILENWNGILKDIIGIDDIEEWKKNYPRPKVTDYAERLKEAWGEITSTVDDIFSIDKSFYQAAIGTSGAILGMDAEAKASHKFLNFKTDGGFESEWDPDKGEIGITAKGKVSGSVWEGDAEASLGLGTVSAGIGALTGAVSGEAEFGLMKNGKFDPSLNLGAKAEGSVLKGEVKGQIGNDDVNGYAKAEGELLGGEAKAGVKFSSEGVKAEAGAEVYLAKGEVKGGFEIFGIKIETEVEGKIGAIGAKVGGEIEDTSVEAEIGASLLGGAGIKVKIDWSEFADGIKKWKW